MWYDTSFFVGVFKFILQIVGWWVIVEMFCQVTQFFCNSLYSTWNLES